MTTITITGGITIEMAEITTCITGKKIVLTAATCASSAMSIVAWEDRGVNDRGNTGDGAICTRVLL
jgi:hypothetical protein